ncbi:hypothetical protein C7S20_12205 [Christiangramia fulva]|uniref:Glycosyl transferase family 1 domain-containing protein n=1 Tax=Christiangramia fulva TaxID=2126553 RepID=A0A2R3Z6R6_9FLAO|nr:glycosyltransferase family 4 protein [Christiangramia fulva]AVR45955.1 hypothetical protein C7S20_12205 [Christiangramia fulva]
MRILFYAHSSTLYGANRSLIELIIGLKTINPQIEIFVVIPNKGPIESKLKKRSIPFQVIKHYNWFYEEPIARKWKKKSTILYKLWFEKNKWQKFLKNKVRLKSHLNFARKFSPDIIYVNSSLCPMGLYVGKKLEKKVIWHHRETVNDNIYGFCLEKENEFITHYNEVDLHLFTSKFLQENYLKNFGKENYRIFYDSVLMENNSNFAIASMNHSIKFGIVGRINKQKGQKEIIELFNSSEIKELGIQLEIFGHGSPNFLKWFEKINSPNINYHGFVNREDIYENFEILISNATFEAFGRTIAEANSCGIPVVVRKSGAFPELVRNNYNGFLFNNSNELKNLIFELSAIKKKEYSILSRNSLEFAKQKFDYLKLAKGIFGAISEVIN